MDEKRYFRNAVKDECFEYENTTKRFPEFKLVFVHRLEGMEKVACFMGYEMEVDYIDNEKRLKVLFDGELIFSE